MIAIRYNIREWIAIGGTRFQIANNPGFINGRISAEATFGKCERVAS